MVSMMRVILLVVSGLCALLMVGGMIGYTYEDSIENVPVPMTGTAVGFADEPVSYTHLTLPTNREV